MTISDLELRIDHLNSLLARCHRRRAKCRAGLRGMYDRLRVKLADDRSEERSKLPWLKQKRGIPLTANGGCQMARETY